MAAASELKDWKTYRTRQGRILESMIAVVEADSDDDEDWHRAWVRWRKTMLDCGWRPPRDERPQRGRGPSPVQQELTVFLAKRVPKVGPK